MSGGVANNKTLVQSLSLQASTFDLPLFVADPKHNGDNAAMIAFAAFIDRDQAILESEFSPLK